MGLFSFVRLFTACARQRVRGGLPSLARSSSRFLFEPSLGFLVDRIHFRLVLHLVFATHAIDKEDSLQMIVFMLDGAREQTAARKLERLPLFILRDDFDVRRPGNIRINLRET